MRTESLHQAHYCFEGSFTTAAWLFIHEAIVFYYKLGTYNYHQIVLFIQMEL